MNVFAYKRTDFIKLGVNDTNIKDSTDYYVSILPTGGPKGEPIFYQQHPNAYTIVFDDVLESGKMWGKDINDYYDSIAITKQQAKDLHSYLKTIPDTANVHVHCVYGESRTGAVAKYLHETRNAVVHNVKLTYVNQRVYTLLKDLG